MPIGFRRTPQTPGTPGAPSQPIVCAPGEEAAEPRGASAPAPEPSPVRQVRLLSLDRADLRRKTALVGALLAVFTLLALCIDPYYAEFVPPSELANVYATFFSQMAAHVTHSAGVLSPTELLAHNKHYFTLLNHTGALFLTIVGGMLLALAGSLYQSVFRNPIASPTMLGVSNGVQVGVLILVLVFGTGATNHAGARYLLCYGCVVLTLVLLFVFSKLISGPGRPLNVVNMLLVGTVLSQLLGIIVTYVTWYVFTDELWEVYNTLSEVVTIETTWYSYAFMGVMTLVSVTPILLMRFRLNVLSFSEADMRLLGVNANRLQVLALTCATLMMVAAQVSVGTVSMLCLVVPHVSRFLFGAEFRKQFAGNVLLGALLLVVCQCVIPFIPLVGSFLPLGTVVSFIVMPVFVWMIATQQRTWE